VFEVACEPLLAVPRPRYTEVSKFPAVIRDLAVVVSDSVPADALLKTLREARPELVQEVRIFDLYRGESVAKGRKSLAFRVVMQDTAKTLTDAEVDATMAQLAQLLKDRFGAERRS
jgi:phenylalanyl-tRNA synthetase beta chain